MTRVTIYGDAISGNCLKVKWAARYLGVPFDWVEVGVASGATRTDAFLRINPFGQVPAAVFPDGRVLTQSNAILLALAEPAGDALIPVDPFERARMYAWLFWEQYSHETAIAVRRYRKAIQRLTDADIDPDLLPRGHRALAHMEASLAGDWFVGPAISLADIALVAYTRVADEGGFDLSAYPKVVAWVARVEGRLNILYPEGRV